LELTRSLDVADAVALAERHMGDLPYRQLVIQDPCGSRVEGELRRAGWKAARHVLMVLRDEPDRGLDTSCVIDASEPEALARMREWTGEEEELQRSPEAHRQVLEACRLIWRARRARRLGVLGPDGGLAGITMLLSDGVVAQVEDVYVVPGQRGRGFGRALVTRAAVLAIEAGHELVFITGDDGDWPKQLYGKVGFEPVGRTWVFHRWAR
jgi:GNAT superfamily N-acetyltransferase